MSAVHGRASGSMVRGVTSRRAGLIGLGLLAGGMLMAMGGCVESVSYTAYAYDPCPPARYYGPAVVVGPPVYYYAPPPRVGVYFYGGYRHGGRYGW